MREPNDWRLTNQLSYLKGVPLTWRPYSEYREGWDHDRCAFCWATFALADIPEAVREGYATPDEYYWVCKACFEDFQDLFEWKHVTA